VGCSKILDFLKEFYAVRVRSDPACGKLKNGEQLYSECLRFHTTTTKSAQEIHDLGLAEVARIEKRFQTEVLDKLEFKGSFTEFAQGLKKDPKYFFKTQDELIDGYKKLVAKIEERLPKYFGKLPKQVLEIVPKQSGPAAYYYAGTADGKRPGRFYVNVSRLEERPRYEMVALALHEGVPGHHLQGALCLENEELPDFLRYIEDRRYEYCPARRPLYTGYLEGWGLYSERLGEEMGLYETPEDLFGRLSMEMMRAVRLVVDTGIHTFDWSIDKAVAYMEEKTGMSTNECSSECHRYAAWPGQATAYKVGQLAIEEMRAAAEKDLGASFDLSKFHDLVLGAGPQPLDFLSRRVDEWKATQKAA
jgi:prolyl oligopeptidase